MPSPIAVVDTSSLYGPSSRKAIVGACNDAKLVAVWSPHVIAELTRNLTLRWIEEYGDSKESVRRMSRSSKSMMDVMTKAFELIDTAPIENEKPIEIVDIDDHHLVRAARLASADYIISENITDFPPKDATGHYVTEGIEFLTRADFWKRFKW